MLWMHKCIDLPVVPTYVLQVLAVFCRHSSAAVSSCHTAQCSFALQNVAVDV